MKSFPYNINNLKFKINITPQPKDILIQCIISDENKYSSVFNLEKLKTIDKLFGGFPSLPLSEIFDILCIYLKDNNVYIKEVSNKRVIIEIEKDFKPNMKFEIERERDINNNINECQKIKKYMNNQIMDINYTDNDNKNLMNNNNISSNNSNYTNNIINYEIKNINNNKKILNENMNNNGSKNFNNMNNIGNMNNNNKISQSYNKNLNYNWNMINNMNFNPNMNNNNYNNYNQNNINYNNNNNCNNNYMNSFTYNNYNNNYNNNNNMNFSTYNNYNNNYNFNNFNNNNCNNNNYNNNNCNNNNCNNKNNIINNYNNDDDNNFVYDGNSKAQEEIGNLGGLNIKNTNNDNFINNNIFHNKNNYQSNYFINNNNKNNDLNKIQNNISLSLNVRTGKPKNNQEGEIKDLSCFLKFLLLKKLTNKIENISKYENLKNVEEVIKFIKNNQDLKEDINLNNKNNILDYLKYLDDKILDKNSLLENLFLEKKEVKNDIFDYWKYLSKYEEYNNNFEHKFFEDLKNCNLDYSIVNMNILERDNPEEYEQKKNECQNMKKMKLYFLSKLNYISNKMKLDFSNESNYGSGFYFSDSIDDIIRYQNKEIIPKTHESFSLIICEIFYDEEKLEKYDMDLSLSESNQNIQEKVGPNGLKQIEIFNSNNNNSKRIRCTEYVLSEKYQILPLYIFTLRKNDYFVIYRDPNFIKNNHYSSDLKEIILKSLKYSNNKNFYFESSTEEALKIILKKKNGKAILITSIGRDESGKRFAEIARKILQRNDLIVLFFSNNTKHLEWIKDFSNCFYASDPDIYEEYISNYNYKGLKKLKEKIEDYYDIKLNFTFDFLSNSNCDDVLSFFYFDYNNDCIYFRSVYILNPKKNLYLSMTKEGKVKKSEKECLWMVTMNENDITLFSNGFYLDIDENKEIAIGSIEMKKWSFGNNENDYSFIYTEKGKNNYLSMEDDEDIRFNRKDLTDYSKFHLIDV